MAPTVTIIVPARNEEACLEACLRSLLVQKGVEFETIVVDDGSTDRTRAIAESLSGVRVISAPPLTSGCSGKCNAVQAGADVARGDWLLFTDADTVHLPGSLKRALREAKEHGADLLSYSPRQVVHGLVERALMTVIFAELASTYRRRGEWPVPPRTARRLLRSRRACRSRAHAPRGRRVGPSIQTQRPSSAFPLRWRSRRNPHVPHTSRDVGRLDEEPRSAFPRFSATC